MDESLVVKDLEPDSIESVTSSSQNNIQNIQSQSPHTHTMKRSNSTSQSSRTNLNEIAANYIEKGGNNFHYNKNSSKMDLNRNDNSPNCAGLSRENSRILKRCKSGAIVEDDFIGKKYLIANPGNFFFFYQLICCSPHWSFFLLQKIILFFSVYLYCRFIMIEFIIIIFIFLLRSMAGIFLSD